MRRIIRPLKEKSAMLTLARSPGVREKGPLEALRRVTVFALSSADSRKEPLLEAGGPGAPPGL